LHFLVMEYVDGNTLQRIVDVGGPLSPLRAAHYTRQAALGLQHAFENGLVHRDVKPANLLVDRAGTVKVLDLGLARFFHDVADDLSRDQGSQALGTADYMAPEQARDSHTADVRSDVYSLGATFYFLLAGRAPFEGETMPEKLLGHQLRQPKPVREIRPDVPDELLAVLDRMLAKEPDERYQTPAEAAAALEPWARGSAPLPSEKEMPDLCLAARSAGSGASTPPTGGELPTVPAPGATGSSTPAARPGKKAEPPARPSGPARRPPFFGPRTVGLAAVLIVAAVGLAFVLRGLLNQERPPLDPHPGPPVGEARKPQPLELLVPAYFYPGGESQKDWDRLIKAAGAVPLVAVVNLDSGPGKEVDPNYAKIIDRAQAAGLTVIGYVSTLHGKRPLEEVRADVERWVHFYPAIQGIFFDAQASGAEHVGYYTALYDAVRKKKGLPLVVTNPGTTCAEDFLARPASDVACLAEGNKGLSAYAPPAWTERYAPERFAALLYQIDTPAQMKRAVLGMRDKRIGYCFVTDAMQPNPWGRLPGYWEEEVEAVRQINAR
jgi:hypothetical protein